MKYGFSIFSPWLGLLLFFYVAQAADGPIVNGQNAENVVGQSTPDGGPDFDNVGPYDTALLTGLFFPYDIVIDTTTHRLFVTDAAHRILVYDLNTSNILVDRTPEHVIGQLDFYGDAPGTDKHRLLYPKGMDYDAVSNRLFVADYWNHRVLVFDVTSITNGENAIHVLGQPDFTSSPTGTTQNSMNYPYEVCYFGNPGNDRLFVSDYSNNRVLVYDVTSITDGENAIFVLGQLNFTTGTSGVTQSRFNGPTFLDIDRGSNRLFVADRTNNRVMVFDVTSITNGENAINVLGQTTFTSGSAARTQGRLSSPFGISFDNGTQRLFVGDYANHRTMIFDVAVITDGENGVNVLGQPDFTSGTPTTTQNGLYNPYGNALDKEGKILYVADLRNNRILSFDVSTTTIVNGSNAVNVVGQTDGTGGPVYTTQNIFDGVAQNGFRWEYDIAIDTSGHRLFVADYTSHRVLVYNLDTNNTIVDRTADYVLGQTNFTNQDIMTNQYSIYTPTGLAFDAATNRLFVVAQRHHRVMVFDVASITNGENAIHVLGQPSFTTSGTANTQSGLNDPYGVALEPGTSRLYVTASGNNRVLVYDVSTITDGEDAIHVLGQPNFTSQPSSLAQNRLRTPTSVTHDGNNHLYVADYGNNRVMVFDTAVITDGENAVNVLGQPDFTSATVSLTAAAFTPWSVAIDRTVNRLFVSDTTNNRILVFDTTIITDGEDAINVLGQTDFTTGTEGYNAGKLNFPMGIVFEPGMNRLYIADQENNRVLVHSVGPVPPSTSTVTVGMGSQAGAIDLSWPSAGDDGVFNPLTGVYRIQYSTSAATAWSTSATPAGAYTATIPATGVIPGVVQSTTVIVGLDQPWYFVLWTQDDASNWSAISSTVSASPYMPPPTPASTIFTARSENTISASWASSVGASSYTFVVSAAPDNPPVSVAGSSNTVALSATVNSLTPNTTYFGFAKACDGVGCSAFTAFGSTVTWANPPLALSTTAFTSTSISLSWNTNGNPTGTTYEIEHATDGVTFSSALITTSIAPTLSGLTPALTYTLRVRSLSHDDTTSAYSATIAVLLPDTLPSLPLNLLGTIGSGMITYTWNPVTTNELGEPLTSEARYEFSESDTPTGTFTPLALSTATTYGPVTPAGVERFYRVRTEVETLFSLPSTVIDNVRAGRYVYASNLGTALTSPQGLLTGSGNPRHIISLSDRPVTDGALVAVDISVVDGLTGTPATNVTFSPSGQLSVPLPGVSSGERSVEYFNGSAWVLAGTARILSPNLAQFSFGRTGGYRLMGSKSSDVVQSVIARVFTPNGDGRNDVTVVRLDNPNGEATHGTIYDTDGARVADMATGPAPGLSLTWDGCDANGASVPGGVYIYQVIVGGRRATGTIVVSK
ncbi:MAG: gliding motility-associated C-terminal domain-containing protein [Elusimicrobia bacterium]|nr:gliding motility-associated C-terminal domain-containing protein [Elusimicrobiota bacterium]